ncbi:hypothetical protein EV363DRAFT_1155136 [Boletus edulis]|nr:hypothetical protein EV363DRAFT_1155136 [Boletus edulis]
MIHAYELLRFYGRLPCGQPVPLKFSTSKPRRRMVSPLTISDEPVRLSCLYGSQGANY